MWAWSRRQCRMCDARRAASQRAVPAAPPAPRTRQRQQARGAVVVGRNHGARLIPVLVLLVAGGQAGGPVVGGFRGAVLGAAETAPPLRPTYKPGAGLPTAAQHVRPCAPTCRSVRLK